MPLRDVLNTAANYDEVGKPIWATLIGNIEQILAAGSGPDDAYDVGAAITAVAVAVHDLEVSIGEVRALAEIALGLPGDGA